MTPKLSFDDELIIKSALIDHKKNTRRFLRLMKGYPVSEHRYIAEITRIGHLIKMFGL
jgi:hypothetical protein